jgi:hypothetical protein
MQSLIRKMETEALDESFEQTYINEDIPVSAKRRWKKLSLFFKGVYLFKNLEAHKIENINSMLESITHIEESPMLSPSILNGGRTRTLSSCAIDEHRRNEKFFHHVLRGGREDMFEIEQIIVNDPRRFMFSGKEDDVMVNKRDGMGQTALYLAAKHGHCDIV